MNPLRRLWDWLRGLFAASEPDHEEDGVDWDQVDSHYFGMLGRLALHEQTIFEIADFAGLPYRLVLVRVVSPEYVIFDVLDKNGLETGERLMRSLDAVADFKIHSRAITLARLERAYLTTPEPEEDPNAEDQDDRDPPGGE